LRGKKVKTGGSRGRARMENELQRTQENLQAFQEEMQTSQEELKSTNEELQSNNEELQSTNEELTTTKEETQSLNEELQTVNAEMQSKMDSYEQMGNDMKNLLNSTEIAVLFIDKELRITQYTFMITKIFKLIPGDIGRPFTDITSDLIYPEITGDITEVMRTLAFMEKDIPTKAGNWYRARIMPYKSKDDRTDGLVITFADITAAKQLETALRDTGLMFKSLMNSSASVIISMSKEGLILELNSVTEKIFVLKREEVVGRDYYSMLVPEIQRDKVRALIQTVLADGLPVAYETGVKRAGGGELTVKWRASRMINEKGIVTGVIIVGTSAAENEK
jgi:two-component system CheB/CheR fusion protein